MAQKKMKEKKLSVVFISYITSKCNKNHLYRSIIAVVMTI